MIDTNKEVTIVIISHRSKKKVVNLIKNISNSIRIIIVENSFDKSIENEISKLGKNIEIIFSENNGYGSAVNLARKSVITKYFFVLNPDMQKIDDKLIGVFCNSAKELNDNFGALGPRFENVSDKSHKQSNINEKFGQIKSISGSAMFFCTEVFDKNGGFDENFFLYFEETDYCNRSNKNNFYIYQVNSQKVYHEIGTSVETTSKEDINKLKNLCAWHFIWSKFYFFKKHYGYIISLIYFLPILLRTYVKMIFFEITSKNKNKYRVRFDGLISAIKGLKSYKRINNF
ncbi:glycosyltransferase [Candidatus Pelagibacter sp.]|nr:glycosyltransferase [Candidatus Pelagibacter sp.]